MIFKSKQIEGDEYIIKKMKSINWVDFFMYITLIITAFLGLTLNLMAETVNEQTTNMFFIIILVVNILYLAFWGFKTFHFLYRRLTGAKRPRSTAPPTAAQQNDELMQKQILGMEKIDKLIEQLDRMQNDLMELSQSDISARNRNSFLIHEAEDFLRENGI